MSQTTILIVEDDEALREALSYTLSKEGYRVVTAKDGEQAISQFKDQRVDLVLLDLMLPKLHGLEVCRLIRRESNIPILILTAKHDEADKVVGLELGADDYMTKPFSMRELVARIRALLRRIAKAPTSTVPLTKEELITCGDLVVDTKAYQATLKGKPLDLARKEFDLLALLVSHRGRAFTREQLLERVWGYDYAGGSRTVDVHMRMLRQKIEDEPASPRRIVTIRGVGYRFEG
jgi:DNA-binding response OmpR family regulator